MFPALTLGAQNSLSVSCVSVFPRSQFRPWFTVPSAQVWWSSASSAQVWWSSAPPWWSSVQVWWSSALSAPPWWAPALSAPHWWASTPPWRSSVLSAPHWWAPALSAPPWRSAVWLWWSSAPPVLPAPSWSPVLPVLPQSQGLTPLHGPGPPSLPLFRLRSTALLDCVMFRASGSRSLGEGALS